METRKNKTPNPAKPTAGIDLKNPSSTPPPGVDPVIYALLLQINTTTQNIDQQVKDLKKKYDELDGKYESVESRCSANEDNIALLQNGLDEMKYKLSVMHGRLIRSEVEKKRLSSELESVKAKSMSKNLIINVKGEAYKEKKQENTLSVVNKFFKKELKLTDTINITAAHRTGVKREDGYRPIIITVPSTMDITKIMSHVKNLKGSGCFIDRQIPQSVNERKQMCLPDFKAARDGGKKPILRDDKLYINNELVRQHLPPTLPDAIEIPDPEDELEISQGDSIDDNGSRFTGFAGKVSCLGDVRETIDALLLKPEIAKSSHVMYAYRIDSGDSMIENFDSDGDWGVGFNMLKFMQDDNIVNFVLIVTRNCSSDFKHIGKKRMEHAVAVSKSALDKIITSD